MAKKKGGRRGQADDRKRDVPMAEEGQMYARVLRMLGNGRLVAKCQDTNERACRIRGSMRKREWVRTGDTVLVSLREFDDTKADVIHRYQPVDVQKLARAGEKVVIVTDADTHVQDDAFAFEAASDDDEDEGLPMKYVRQMPDSESSGDEEEPGTDIDWERI